MKTTEVLNDLIRINNDRIEGYAKAINEIKNEDIDLHNVFSNCINQSQEFADELAEKITLQQDKPATDNTFPGKVYRGWIELKATFTGDERQGILESCEHGEDATQKAYANAVSDGPDIATDVLQLIKRQKESLKKNHDLIKEYREACHV